MTDTLPHPETIANNQDQLLISYRAWLSQQSLSPNTMRIYHSRVKQFVFFLEISNLDKLSSASGYEEATAQYRSFLKRTGHSAQSLNASLNALKNFAQYLGFPLRALARERSSVITPEFLDLDEQMRFLRSAERQNSLRDRALALVLFYTGLRIGDCALLDIKDVSASGETIYLANASIQLNRQTSRALIEWVEQRRQLNRSTMDSGLWLTSSGHRLSIQGIAFVVKRIGWQANLAVSVETLRRTFLSNQAVSSSRKAQITKCGAYISASTLRRYAI